MPQQPVKTTLFVSQILAGSGLTVSPSDGTGVVTISIDSGEVYNPAAVAITGGTINGVTIGGTTPEPVTTSALHVDTGTKTATASSGAATLNKMAGVITSESLTTAAGADYTLTLTDSDIAAADQVMASVQLTTAGGTPAVASVTPAAGSVVIVVQNIHASAAFAGAIKISFVVFKN